MTIQKFFEYEDFGSYGFLEAGEDLVSGFVYLSGTDKTVFQCGASGTKKPIGVAVNSYSEGETVTIVDKGIVNMICDTALSAGQPVFPASTAGRVIATGANDGSGVPYFYGGFGTVVTGASASGVVAVKLQLL
jgi:hypothetical protein